MEQLKPRSGAAVAAVLLVAACGGSLRKVPVGPHATAGSPPVVPVVVEEPPPPAKVENIPDPPRSECAWLDGRWEWVDEAWVWTPGAWVIPPEGCHFAVPEALWVPAPGRGLLFYLPGRWYRDSGSSACGVPRACNASQAPGP